MPDTGTYLSFKIAQQLYKKTLDSLQPEERQRVESVAAKQMDIEALILGAPEAARVMLPESSIDSSLMEIRARYGNEDEYLADLDRIGLDERGLRSAIERDLTVETVLERVGARAASVSDTDVEIFYFMHKERFRRPETRVLRHILVTINETMPGNERDAAHAKMQSILARLIKDSSRFEEQALKHSECPTAMNGGILGTVKQGQLYAELEPIAFALTEGSLSEICESPIGFHILRCDSIEPARTLSLKEARERIRTHLEDQRRQICQKSWVNALRREAKAA
jgi:nitrogen fixation protein NifM